MSFGSAISEFQAAQKSYLDLAQVVEAALLGAVREEYPEAQVTSRVKSEASFVEKVVRKGYVDPLTDMTDLCGVRVVVQTSAHVSAVRMLIEANFVVHEREDKLERLQHAEFGYRDLHLLVSIPPSPRGPFWQGREDLDALTGRRFELQVRTWLQHVWAELVHDRFYKPTMRPTRAQYRRAAALAALLEEGDRLADDVARAIDERVMSYTQWASRDDVTKEIAHRKSLLTASGTVPKVSEVVALARMQRAVGDLDGAIATLRSHGREDPSAEAELGYCLCLRAWDLPESDEYAEGCQKLKDSRHVPGWSPRVTAEQVRRLSRLAWAVSREAGGYRRAHDLIGQAWELDPDNPYLLSDALVLGHAAGRQRGLDWVSEREVRRAISICAEHGADGIELPQAHFTAGRLSLLLGDAMGALNHYSRGLVRLADKETCGGTHVRKWERHWLELMEDWPGVDIHVAWVRQLLAEPSGRTDSFTPAIIQGRGPEGLHENDLARVRVLPPAMGMPIPDAIEQAIRAIDALPCSTANLCLVDTLGGDAVFSRVALALGAEVAICGPPQEGSVLTDPVWQGRISTLLPIPDDESTFRAILHGPEVPGAALTSEGDTAPGHERMAGLDLTPLAQAIHARYLDDMLGTLPPPKSPWEKLPDTYVASNLAQARGIVGILQAVGYDVVREGQGDPVHLFREDEDRDEVTEMARLEHGRWNAERLRNGWRLGARDDDSRRHDNLVSWEELPEPIRDYDRAAVRGFPAVLEKAGFVIVRSSQI